MTPTPAPENHGEQEDRRWMQRALALAAATVGEASPNPRVGCVLVSASGELLGEGAHRYAQRDHAEVVALKQAAALSRDVRGATAYVTLEPCSHHGRTPPCADALIAAGIGRCVVATADPNPLVSGGGLARLRAAGIAVTSGPCTAEARALNNAFAWSVVHRSPFVTLKSALSVDGRLAPPPATRTATAPHWLTGPESRAEVQRLRHGSDAILTGIGTVLADDPALTDRTGLPRRRPLMRIVLDRALQLPLGSTLLREPASLHVVCTTRYFPLERYEALKSRGVTLSTLPDGSPGDVKELLATLYRDHAIQSLLLESGPGLNSLFLAGNLVGQLVLFFSETELPSGSVPFATSPGGVAVSPFSIQQRMTHVTHRTFGPDACVSGLLHDPWAGLAPL